MNQTLVSVLAIAFLLSGCAVPASEGIEVREAWARPAAQAGNSAVYFVIRSSEMDEMTGVSSDVAEATEMHESILNGDVMEMRHLESVVLDAGEQVSFEPGGLHVMLVSLKQALNAGDEIEITLHFKNHQDLQLRVPVEEDRGTEMEH